MLGRGISIDGTATAINGERVALLGIAEEDKFQVHYVLDHGTMCGTSSVCCRDDVLVYAKSSPFFVDKCILCFLL
jgi:hypothetical protein